MLEMQSCAVSNGHPWSGRSTQCRLHCFGHWSYCTLFLKVNKSLHPFYCQTKKDVQMRTCCCSLERGKAMQVGVIAHIRWELSAGSSVTISQLSLSCIQGIWPAQRRLEG